MNNRISESLQKGFALTNKAWRIILIGLSLLLLTYPADFLSASPIKSVLEVLGFLLFPIMLGYHMSIPIFLVQKQQGKTLKFGNLLSVTLQNTKRLIVPGILLFLLFIILVFLCIFISSGNMNIFNEYAFTGFDKWNLWNMLLINTFSLFSFVPIYFSLEKNGLLSSFKKSLGFSFRHFNFAIILFLISCIYYSFTTLVLQILFKQFEMLIWYMLSAYQIILLTAVPLIFYQSIVGKKV